MAGRIALVNFHPVDAREHRIIGGLGEGKLRGRGNERSGNRK